MGRKSKQINTATAQGETIEALLKEIIDHLDEGVFLTDKQGKIQDWNSRMAEISGLPAEAAAGMPAWDVLYRLFPEDRKTPGVYERLKANLLELLLLGKCEWSEGGWEVELQAEDGEGAPARLRPVRIDFRVVPQEDGFAAAGLVCDLTGPREVQQQMQLQLQALESAAHGISITNLRGEILWVNPAFTRITGFAPEEAVGNTFKILKSGKQDAQFYQNLWTTVLAGEVWHGELINRRKDGTLYTEEQTITPVLDTYGQVTHFIAIIEDVTGKKAVEKAAQEQRMLAEALRETASSLVRSIEYEEVLDHILENLERVVHHDAANIMIVDAEGKTDVKRSRGYAERGQEESVKSMRIPAEEMASFRKVLASNSPVVIPDTGAEPGWLPYEGLDWIKSHISAPIRKGERVIGFLNVDSATPAQYTQTEADSLQDFADQAAVVLENSRLFEETSRRAYELEILFHISSALRNALTRQEIGNTVLDDVMELLHVDGARLVLWDPEAGERSGPVIEQGRGIWKNGGPAGSPTARAQSELENQDEPQHKPEAAGQGGKASVSQMLGDVSERLGELKGQVESTAGMPLLAYGQEIGALWLHRVGAFNEQDLRLAEATADLLASALHRATLFEQTQERLKKLGALRAIDLAITSGRDINPILEVLLDQVMEQLKPHAAAVLLLNPDTLMLNFAAGRGFREAAGRRIALPVNRGLAGRAMTGRRTLSVPDLHEIKDAFVREQMINAEGFVSYHAVPLMTKEQVRGLLEVYYRTPFHPSREWVEFLEALAGQAAIAVENTELYNRLRRSNRQLAEAYSATLEGWSKALELRDQETLGHTERVTDLTLHIANNLDFDDEDLIHLRHGALLHDIGKMGIPDSILLKPGPLNQEEWEIMRMHPRYAFDLLSPIAFLRPALDIPHYHHERWDGSGYPYGLSGENIPLAARMFSVIDVWDALLSDRPYRAAWPAEKVRSYLQEEAGQRFDPAVVEVFFESLGDRAYGLGGLS